ncbi:MAG TPA: glycosyltransferase family 4 protein [Azospirillaceae bacterium]|nr:glycosyltransferase family 4 protein [Azospirillaceae bacterium]
MTIPDRLLIVSPSYWPEPAGSAPMVTDLATGFASAGCHTTVLTARPYYPDLKVLDGYADGRLDSTEIEGVRIERLPTVPPKGGGMRARLVFESMLTLGVARALLGGRVDRHAAVLALCPSILMVMAAVGGRRRGGRLVVLVHDIQSGLAAALGMAPGGARLAMLRGLERAVLNRADAVAVLSEPMRDVLRRLGVTVPIEVIPPHVDTDTIMPLEPTPDRPPTVLYSGAFARKQGLEQVLAMAAILQGRRPEVPVILRGGGPMEEGLRAMTAERGLANVTFRPLCPRDLLNEGLAEGDIHLVPQRPEGAAFAMPGKVVTILAAGRPLVATALPGGTLDRLAQATGAFLCVPPNEPEALARAVIALIDDPERRRLMGHCGRAWVEANASRRVVLERYARLLRTAEGSDAR